MNKFVKWGIVGGIAIGLTVIGVNTFVPQVNEDLKEAPGKGGRKPGGRELNVRGVVMKEQSLTDGLFVSGSVIPDEQVDLSFETSGKITAIHFREGARVAKGQLLAKINDAPLQAELRRLEAQLKLFQDRMYRQNALLEKEAVSQEAFQEAQTNLATLQAEIDMVKAKIAQTELRAPFDGVLGLREVSQGTYASPTTTVAKLTKTNPLKIEFAVPERYAGMLMPGNELKFSVEGDLEERSAKLYATDSHVDSDTRTYTVRALYDNSDGKLVPGRYVNVSLTTQEFDKTIAVPSQAIISEMGIDKVFVYHSGKAEPVEITKGLRTDKYVQVLRGLSIGDTVITTGIMQLRVGQKVILDAVE
ncbi:MAG: efflux RND transporter periplasmic adaptor subunit [Bacteroidaceae bacterium]|nr:efflux RND transporter periplasmic adaptor subunit [Bacteroidaceae bacterium]